MQTEETQTGASESPAPAPVTRRRPERASFDALAAELEQGADRAVTPPNGKPVVKPADPPPLPPPDKDTDDVETEDGDDAPPDKPEAPEKDAGEIKIDPAAQKRMEGIQRAEKKMRDRIAAERAEADKIIAEWKPKIEKAEKFESLAKRAKYAAADVLAELGLTEDDFESAARDLYSRSKAGAKDPKARVAVERNAREREKDDRIASLEKKLDDLANGLTSERANAQATAAVTKYVDDTVKRATTGDDAPIIKKWLATNPARARAQLEAEGNHLAREMGGVPDHADVVARLEAKRREELTADGFDVDAWLARDPEKPAGKTVAKPSRTLGKSGGGAPAPRDKPPTRDALFSEILGDLDLGKDKSPA